MIATGRTGEFIAAARIELGGWRAVPATADGVDIIAMRGKTVLRIQVKSTRQPAAGGNYAFSTCRRTAKIRRHLTRDDCDAVALVVLDRRLCIFCKVEDITKMTTRRHKKLVTSAAEATSFRAVFVEDKK